MSATAIYPRVLGVIPARLGSTRLPRKVLRELAGQPLLAWVWEAAARCPVLDDLVIATDSAEVMELCQARGWKALLTSPELPSGTDRVFAVSRAIDAEIYVNVQGDEPLLHADHLSALLSPLSQPHVDASTLKVACPAEAVNDPNVVKVVTALDGRALYFSRAAIPYEREPPPTAVTQPTHWKHLGLYAYRRAALERFAALPPSRLECIERLEQLRLLENGLALYVAESPFDTVGVDTEHDLRRAEAMLLNQKSG